jgi:hypothetical protein
LIETISQLSPIDLIGTITTVAMGVTVAKMIFYCRYATRFITTNIHQLTFDLLSPPTIATHSHSQYKRKTPYRKEEVSNTHINLFEVLIDRITIQLSPISLFTY